jgi:hypothetical protein
VRHKCAFKRKNKVEEGRASCSKVKIKQKSIDLKAQKMMKGIVEPFIVPTVVRVVPLVV